MYVGRLAEGWILWHLLSNITNYLFSYSFETDFLPRVGDCLKWKIAFGVSFLLLFSLWLIEFLYIRLGIWNWVFQSIYRFGYVNILPYLLSSSLFLFSFSLSCPCSIHASHSIPTLFMFYYYLRSFCNGKRLYYFSHDHVHGASF